MSKAAQLVAYGPGCDFAPPQTPQRLALHSHYTRSRLKSPEICVKLLALMTVLQNYFHIFCGVF